MGGRVDGWPDYHHLYFYWVVARRGECDPGVRDPALLPLTIGRR